MQTDTDVTGQPALTEHQKIQHEQALRIRRLAMSFASYLVTFTLVSFCAWVELIPWSVAGAFLVFAVLINGVFLALYRAGINMRFRDPSLTSAQMVVSLLPALYVMFHLEDGQARAIFMVIAIVPALYGMLALNTRQFIVVGLLFLLLYGGLMLSLWLWRPEILTPSLELIQALAFTLVIAELAMIGGFISGLRNKLRRRNDELNEALVQISDMANRDALTGLANRRHLFDLLAQEANRYRRTQGPFSICILDVDYFKPVNDTYGHQAGDLVLRRIAETIAGSLRNIDFIGRYGGEEFLIVLPQTPLEGAMIKADRIRSLIAETTYPEIIEDLVITVSIGVAEYRSPEDTDETISRADQALYRAKDLGRNRCVAEEARNSPQEDDSPLP